jgi:hypothetical protein
MVTIASAFTGLPNSLELNPEKRLNANLKQAIGTKVSVCTRPN